MAQIGVNAWVWTSPVNTEAFAKLAPRVKEMGFDLIEFGVEGTGDLDYKRASEIARDLGLGTSVCAAMGPDRDLIHPDESIRKSSAEYVRHCIDAAEVLGGAQRDRSAVQLRRPLLAADAGRARERPRRPGDAAQGAVEVRRRSRRHACVEPLNRFETSFLNLAEQAIEVVDRVDHPSCGILLDTFHMNIEEKSIGDAIRAAGPRLKHLHTCENDRGAPGSGHVPWDEVAAACRDIDFDGPFVIESFTSAVKSIARAAAIWRSFAPSQDALAQDGLKHLRALLAHSQAGSQSAAGRA